MGMAVLCLIPLLSACQDSPSEEGLSGGTYELFNNSTLLNMRREPSTDAEVLQQIPSAAKVRVYDEFSGSSASVSGFEGKWLHIHYNDLDGYVFSGFLAPHPPREDGESLKDYADRVFGPVESETVEETLTDFSGKVHYFYSHGTRVTVSRHEHESQSIMIPDINMQEMFLIFRYYDLPYQSTEQKVVDQIIQSTGVTEENGQTIIYFSTEHELTGCGSSGQIRHADHGMEFTEAGGC